MFRLKVQHQLLVALPAFVRYGEDIRLRVVAGERERDIGDSGDVLQIYAGLLERLAIGQPLKDMQFILPKKENPVMQLLPPRGVFCDL